MAGNVGTQSLAVTIRVLMDESLTASQKFKLVFKEMKVGFSLMVAMIVSSIVGTVVPIFFHKLNIDPAVASGPLITTVNDLVAVVTYYGLAWILLINLLHIA